MASQLWATNSLGGHATNNKLSQKMREQAQGLYVWRQFCDIKEGGKNKGDIVY